MLKHLIDLCPVCRKSNWYLASNRTVSIWPIHLQVIIVHKWCSDKNGLCHYGICSRLLLTISRLSIVLYSRGRRQRTLNIFDSPKHQYSIFYFVNWFYHIIWHLSNFYRGIYECCHSISFSFNQVDGQNCDGIPRKHL